MQSSAAPATQTGESSPVKAPLSASALAGLKQLRIHTGVVRRLAKEVEMYRTEAVQLQAKLDSLKEQQKAEAGTENEHRIRKQQEVLRESQMMVPDTERRLIAAKQKLASLLTQHRTECGQDPTFLAAEEEMQRHQQQLAGDC